MSRTIVLFALTLGLVCCQNQETRQKSEAEELMKLSREWAKVATTGDVEKTLQYWAADAVVMSPGQPALQGRDAIRQMLIATSKIPGYEVNWEPKEAYVANSGDLGYVIAQNYFKMKDSLGNPVTTFNKGVEIWRKQADGTWKNVVDIFNADPTITSIR